MKVERRLHLDQLVDELVVAGNPFAVRVDHHEANPARLGGFHEVDDLRMNRRLASRKLHDFRSAFGPHEVVEHRFNFFERQAEPGPRRREAQRTIHVAHAVDLNDPEAGVLLMVGTQSAVVRTAPLVFGAERQRNGSRFVVPAVRDIRLCVPVDERLEGAAGWTPLSHVDLVVSENHLRVDHATAVGADAPRQLVEDVVRVGLGHGVMSLELTSGPQTPSAVR